MSEQIKNECYSDIAELLDELDDLSVNEDSAQSTNANFKRIKVGICAMETKVIAKPMEEILCRLEKFQHLHIIIFPQPIIIHLPPEDWPQCDCLICFQSTGFPLEKAKRYVQMHHPFLINDVAMQIHLLNRTDMYRVLDEAGVPHPKYIVVPKGTTVIDQDDQIEVNGETLSKPFVEKPLNADDHNIYIYFQSSVGGGCQRLFRKIGCRSSVYSTINEIRTDCDYIYEEFMPTDGIDVKVYTVGPDYAHAEARKSPGLDGKVDRDEYGKEVRYPIILRAEEKLIARKICLAFGQNVCGFDLLRANGKSYVCDVNGFSFVKNSLKYYDDCSLILGNMIMRALAPHMCIPYSPYFRPEDVPIVPTTYGTMMELRCVIAVIRHGDRTPKQKMKMEVSDPLFLNFFEKSGGLKKNDIKLKRPSDLQAVLDITRQLIQRYDEKSEAFNRSNLPVERLEKLLQLKSVLEMYGHFSGINRKVQMKKRTRKCSKPIEEGIVQEGNELEQSRILLILKWGGELTDVGRKRAILLGEAFRTMYPSGNHGSRRRSPDSGLLRLHSTYRHDLKIYASDEGRVQMTAAAFTKGMLALEGQLAPILVQMVKSANTNGLLDDNCESARLASRVKEKLSEYLSVDRVLSEEDISKIVPTRQKALIEKLREIGNPLAACRSISEYIGQMTDHIRMKMMDAISYKLKLYHSESWELMLRRWTKLGKDFYDRDTGSFDFCKISVIYDCIKHDYVYNQRTLQFVNGRELYLLSKLLSEVIVPQEYGLHMEEKLSIARGIISPLLNKIRNDLQRNVDLSTKTPVTCAADLTQTTMHSNSQSDLASTNEQRQQLEEDENDECDDDEECNSRLDPRRLTAEERSSRGIQTPGRHVRTRLYFTSESHVHSLINVLKYGELFQTPNSQWTAALEHLETVAELGYLTQIIIKLYEDPNVPKDSDNRFHIEMHFSSGSSEDVVPEQNVSVDEVRCSNSRKPSGLHQQPSLDRPIVLGQSLITLPMSDDLLRTVRRSGSREDVRKGSRFSSQERSYSRSRKKYPRESKKPTCGPCNQHSLLNVPSSDRAEQFFDTIANNQYTYTAGLGEELRNLLVTAIRSENLEDPSFDFVAASQSPSEYEPSLTVVQNDLHTLHNSLNARDFNLFLERMLQGVSTISTTNPTLLQDSG